MDTGVFQPFQHLNRSVVTLAFFISGRSLDLLKASGNHCIKEQLLHN